MPHFLLRGSSVVILSSSTSASSGKSLIKELSLEYILSASAGDPDLSICRFRRFQNLSREIEAP